MGLQAHIHVCIGKPVLKDEASYTYQGTIHLRKGLGTTL